MYIGARDVYQRASAPGPEHQLQMQDQSEVYTPRLLHPLLSQQSPISLASIFKHLSREHPCFEHTQILTQLV
jgi:hypothetical protein